MRFPKGFLWGTGTSSYQVEGAVGEDGRSPSIWDHFCRIPGKVKNGDTGDLACDHYHRWEEDLDLMAALGLGAYRFSVAWPRVLPEGNGRVNPKGLDFYKRVAEGCLKRGIRPMITLYHWDLPQVLQEKGGWANREVAEHFAEFTAVTVRALGDLVPDWITHNEPWVIGYLGYAWGTHAPGLADERTALAAIHHLLLSHGLGVQAFRAAAPKNSRIGIVFNMGPIYPLTDSPEDRAAAWRADGVNHRWFIDPVMRGAYPADTLAHFERKHGPLPFIQPGDLTVAAQPIDFLGFNIYSCGRVSHDPEAGDLQVRWHPPVGPTTAMGWEIWPDSIHDLLVRIKADYGEIPLYVTENGAAFDDRLDEQGQVADEDRIAYLRGHIASAWRAIQAGVNLQGYFVWSLLDNFEWAEGYEKRFGIVYVDYPTLRRIPKQSFYFYRDLIRANGLA
ncbi:MAG: GH1 family beta-glucosidase [Bacillota bacterium]